MRRKTKSNSGDETWRKKEVFSLKAKAAQWDYVILDYQCRRQVEYMEKRKG